MKTWMINWGLVVLLFGIVVSTNWRVRDKIFELKYDFLNENKLVDSKQGIDEILSKIKTIKYSELDKAYLENTKSQQSKYKSLIKNLKYFKVKRNDLNKRIVGRFRLKEFICKDDYYVDCILKNQDEIICIFNPKIFYKTLELLDELNKSGYNSDGFYITSGHRHPRFNEEIGGAKLSRHIKGEAVDITIEDINDDGYVDKKDKKIVLKLLERKIIKDKGGIGLYPRTDNVHYDVRGVKARWNSY